MTAPKAPPKSGWRNDAYWAAPEPRRKLAAMGLPDALIDDLADMLADWAGEATTRRPTPAERKSALEPVARHARELSKALAGLDGWSSDLIAAGTTRNPRPIDKIVAEIAAAADAALRQTGKEKSGIAEPQDRMARAIRAAFDRHAVAVADSDMGSAAKVLHLACEMTGQPCRSARHYLRKARA